MSLSSELISQFAKITNDKTEVKQESTHYGTTVEYNGDIYVQLDGSDLLTPISTTADTKAGERVMVMIKNHTATVTGNLSSPAARTGTVTELDGKVTEFGTKIDEFENIIAESIDTEKLQAIVGQIEHLTSDNVIIREHLDANTADIDRLEADNVTINEKLTATEADIEKLETEKLSAEEAEVKFANIDFSNIGTAAIEEFLSKSGLIEDLTVGDGIVTGKLVGVTIIGDLIEGGTVKADKLVVKGSDGIYYKLNFEAGNFAEGEAVPDDSLHGSIITAKSITAEKVSVTDLVAFGATIGGFKITDNAIHSVAKTSATNATRGLYMDNEGQMSFGDMDRYLKYYKDQNGVWKLEIAVDDVLIGSEQQSIDTVLGDIITTAEQVIGVANKAQEEADAAKAYIDHAQDRADETQASLNAAIDESIAADENASQKQLELEAAQQNLADILARGDATDDEIQAAQEAVDYATLIFNTATSDAEAAQRAVDSLTAQFAQDLETVRQAQSLADNLQAIADALRGDIDRLAKRVTDNETAVIQNSNEIELRAKKTEVDTALNEVETRFDETVLETKADLALAERNLQNLEARAGTTEEELESAKREVANAQAAVDAAMEDLLTTKQTVADLKVQSDNVNIEVKKIIDYGVDKVTTSMGYTFNDDGLHIQKPGQEIINTLDDEGMSVTRGEEVMLKADKDGVIATDVKVRNYLIVGNHARFEDYNDGTDGKRTACFWING